MSQEDIEASRAPVMEHLSELRKRLIWSVLAIAACFIVCFYFADEIFNILLVPYQQAGDAVASRQRDRLWVTPRAGLHCTAVVFLYPNEAGAVRRAVPCLPDYRLAGLDVRRSWPLCQ